MFLLSTPKGACTIHDLTTNNDTIAKITFKETGNGDYYAESQIFNSQNDASFKQVKIHSGKLDVSLDILNTSDSTGPYSLARSAKLVSSDYVQMGRPFDLLVETINGQKTLGTCSLVLSDHSINETAYLTDLYKLSDKKSINPLKLFASLLLTSFGIIFVLFVIYVLYKQRRERAVSAPQELIEINDPNRTNVSPRIIDISSANEISGGDGLKDEESKEQPEEELEELSTFRPEEDQA